MLACGPFRTGLGSLVLRLSDRHFVEALTKVALRDTLSWCASETFLWQGSVVEMCKRFEEVACGVM